MSLYAWFVDQIGGTANKFWNHESNHQFRLANVHYWRLWSWLRGGTIHPGPWSIWGKMCLIWRFWHSSQPTFTSFFVEFTLGQITWLTFDIQAYGNYIKPDGSFSEAGVPWPWSCSSDVCSKYYTSKSIDILTQVDYTTTLPTMASSDFLMDQTTAPGSNSYCYLTESRFPKDLFKIQTWCWKPPQLDAL